MLVPTPVPVPVPVPVSPVCVGGGGVGTNEEKRLQAKLPVTQLYSTRPLLELMSKAEALVAGDVSVGKVMLLKSSAGMRQKG